MPPFLLPFAVLVAFFRELWDLFKKPKYRGLLYWVGLVLLVGVVFYNRLKAGVGPIRSISASLLWPRWAMVISHQRQLPEDCLPFFMFCSV